MTDQMPTLGVIIPALNAERTIEAAVESALLQDGVTVNVVVIDAGSTDSTAAVVQSMPDSRIRLISGVGRLLAGAARNIGIAASESTWLGFLDADDLWPRCRTEHLLEVIADPAHEVAVGHMLTFPDGALVDASQHWALDGSIRAPIAGCVLLSRELFRAVGYFEASLQVGEFIDWFARARSLGIREVSSSNVVLLRRSHQGNSSRIRKDDYPSSILRIAVAHRARQRRLLQDDTG